MDHAKVAKKAVERILDTGLAESTFREKHPKAYKELLHYRADLEADIVKVVKRYDR